MPQSTFTEKNLRRRFEADGPEKQSGIVPSGWQTDAPLGEGLDPAGATDGANAAQLSNAGSRDDRYELFQTTGHIISSGEPIFLKFDGYRKLDDTSKWGKVRAQLYYLDNDQRIELVSKTFNLYKSAPLQSDLTLEYDGSNPEAEGKPLGVSFRCESGGTVSAFVDHVRLVAAAIYTLTVKDGSGSGSYGEGLKVNIVADTIPDKRFVHWTTSDGGRFGDFSSASTTYTMLDNNTVLTAHYLSKYPLTVDGGSGSGSVENGQTVDLVADVMAGQTFIRWTTSDGGKLGDANSASTSYTMPDNVASVTANYVANSFILSNHSFEANGSAYQTDLVPHAWQSEQPAGGLVPKFASDGANAAYLNAASNVKGDNSTLGSDLFQTSGHILTAAENITLTFDTRRRRTNTGDSGRVRAQLYYLDNDQRIELASLLVDLPDDSFKYNQTLNYTVSDAQAVGKPLGVAFRSESFGETWVVVDHVKVFSDAINPSYALTVDNGSGGGNYAEGQGANIVAPTTLPGLRFANWTTSDGGSFRDANSVSTTYTMPAKTAVVTAHYISELGVSLQNASFEADGPEKQSGIVPSGWQTDAPLGEGLDPAGATDGANAAQLSNEGSSDNRYRIFQTTGQIISSGESIFLKFDGYRKLDETSSWGKIRAQLYYLDNGQRIELVSEKFNLYKSEPLQSGLTLEYHGSNPEAEGKPLGISFRCESGGTVSVFVDHVKMIVTNLKPRTLTVENGSGDTNTTQGTSNPISTDPAPQGYLFSHWMTDNGGSFGDAYSASTTYTMPGNDATVTALYRYNQENEDGDSLWDGWEIAHFGATNITDGSGDFDRDGVSDHAEFLSGSDPKDRSSYLRIIKSDYSVEDGQMTLRFTTNDDIATRRYRIYYSETLQAGSWKEHSMGSFLPDPGVYTEKTFDVSAGANSKFFKIGVSLEE